MWTSAPLRRGATTTSCSRKGQARSRSPTSSHARAADEAVPLRAEQRSTAQLLLLRCDDLASKCPRDSHCAATHTKQVWQQARQAWTSPGEAACAPAVVEHGGIAEAAHNSVYRASDVRTGGRCRASSCARTEAVAS